MVGVAMRSVDGDLVAAALQAHGGVNDQPLGATNAQVRVEEDNVLLGHCTLQCRRRRRRGIPRLLHVVP
jgi:hypothetical protein